MNKMAEEMTLAWLKVRADGATEREMGVECEGDGKAVMDGGESGDAGVRELIEGVIECRLRREVKKPQA